MAVIFVATLPSLWAAFVPRPAIVLSVCLAIYGLPVSLIELTILCAVEPPAGRPSLGEIFTGIYIANLVQCGIVFTIMRIYHALGFRLQRVPRKAATPEAEPVAAEAPDASLDQGQLPPIPPE
jgi:hypothetical protein